MMNRLVLAFLFLALVGLSHVQAEPISRNLQSDESTTPPTDGSSTTPPTDGSSTTPPTDGSSTMGSTDSPTDGASSIAPSTEEPSSLAPSTDVPTEMATMMDTDGATEGSTEKEEEEENCQEETYAVYVDLQTDYPGDNYRSCTEEENIEISEKITFALNTHFADADPDWEGEVIFSDHVFDDSQIVDKIGAGFSNEGRRLRARQLQDDKGTCGDRGSIECLDGYCRWGCLEALAKDCSDGQDGSTEHWHRLGGHVAAQLATLTDGNGVGNGFGCLGITKEMEVVVTLNPGTAPPEETRAIQTDPPREEFPDTGFLIMVDSEVDVTYFNFGVRTMEGSCDVAQYLMELFQQFEEDNLNTSPAYQNKFNGMNHDGLQVSYDADIKTLKLQFVSEVYSTEEEPNVNTPHKVAKEMVKGNFHELLQTMKDEADARKGLNTSESNPCPSFDEILTGVRSVSFTATGTGARRL